VHITTRTDRQPSRRNCRLVGALKVALTFGHPLPVHPVEFNTKTPILRRWPDRASCDRKVIRRWWRKWPRAGVGLATGGEARLLVVDIDPGGSDALRALERQHGALPPTIEVRTPRGGRHIWLTVPPGRPLPGNSAGKLGRGIDTRCQGGYVLCPPSTVRGRPYRWRSRPGAWIHPAPDWLLVLLDQHAGRNGAGVTPEQWLELIRSTLAEGEGRNAALTSISGLLFRFMPARHAELVAELCACWNEVRCRPPLDADELATILDSIAGREAQRRRRAAGP
jgi:Bifunctional DNA primase/polymerase, N-terminal